MFKVENMQLNLIENETRKLLKNIDCPNETKWYKSY